MRKKAVNKDFVRCSAFDLHYSLYVINYQLINRAAVLFIDGFSPPWDNGEVSTYIISGGAAIIHPPITQGDECFSHQAGHQHPHHVLRISFTTVNAPIIQTKERCEGTCIRIIQGGHRNPPLLHIHPVPMAGKADGLLVRANSF